MSAKGINLSAIGSSASSTNNTYAITYTSSDRNMRPSANMHGNVNIMLGG